MHFGQREPSGQGCKVSQGEAQVKGLGGSGGGSQAAGTERLLTGPCEQTRQRVNHARHEGRHCREQSCPRLNTGVPENTQTSPRGDGIWTWGL